MKKIIPTTIFSSFCLTAIGIAGCSNEIPNKTLNNLKYSFEIVLINNIVEALSEPLNVSLNTKHVYLENVDESKLTTNGNTELYGALSQKCSSTFKITKDDVKFENGLTGNDVEYSLKPISKDRLKPFTACVEREFYKYPLDATELRIFLTEPNLKKFKNNPAVRDRLKLIKAKNSITYKDAFDIYKLLNNASQKELKDVNQDLIKNL
ncbi:TPA: hypothetical protein MW242_003102 [Acinetobacter baumannii]|nr:hypothetical protein [Acinetobacter baumannii]